MKHTVIGTLAHVDAGKTTLSESMLYTSGSIRKIGRVDHKDAFLDFNEQERGRGITIYLKEASFTYENTHFTLVDTPGHVDFSCEMERSLQVLDYAIVLISGIDGIQPHTETIWKLLKHYDIPAFIFVNKMDIAYKSEEELMQQLKGLDSNCICFHHDTYLDEVSMVNETLMESFLSTQSVDEKDVIEAIFKREMFPVFFGSALKNTGIERFLKGMSTYIKKKEYPEEFGAKIYKITHDENGNKLTHVKVMGGKLVAKQKLNDTEKIDQIRIYQGNKFNSVNEVEAGRVCALKGLKSFVAGEGLGICENSNESVLTPFMNYHMVLPKGVDAYVMMQNLMIFMHEDPQMKFYYDEDTKEIHVELMGEIQIDVLKTKIEERFNVKVDFDHGKIRYKETITNTVEGVGHFEPLRHYAEVHVLLEPLPQGSGMMFESKCDSDTLSLNWQRLILTHMEEKNHKGVLTGSYITDIKITLLSGKAHLKHTEGGDFRQATYRAIRQALKKSESILLEPYYQFRLIVPQEFISRAIFDLENKNASFTMHTLEENTLFVGSGPVKQLQNYSKEVYIYTKGKGKYSASLKGYEPCKNSKEVIEKIAYDSELDRFNPTGSVFCKQGAGFYVPWNEVEEYMHLPYAYEKQEKPLSNSYHHNRYSIDDDEVKRVFNSITGGEKRKKYVEKKKEKEVKKPYKAEKVLPPCLLVDGYNMIFGWDDLKVIASENIESARNKLIDMLLSYQGYKNMLMIIVFDAYKREEHQETIEKISDNAYVVYTKTSQTADSYIEKTAHKYAKEYRVSVATSDALEQVIVSGQGASIISARELFKEVRFILKTKEEEHKLSNFKNRNTPLMEMRKLLEDK